MSLVRSLEWQYLPPAELPRAEVIVVLGGGTRSQAYPRPIHEIGEAGDRLLYAAYLYHQGVAPHLLLSGGVVAVDGPALQPEAEAMATLLTLLNVPHDALWLEPRSRNTHENAVETRKLLEPRGINRIVLVTSAMHMLRAVAIFEKQGFEVVPAPTDF
ncbi:MAG: YdcF family protein, partial [Caldilineaceae bacterium]|nr:YdcF family protein [Caldilineaceae bacterium]